MKNYAEKNDQWMAQNGLLKCWVREAATGTRILLYRNETQVKEMRKKGRFVDTGHIVIK